MSQSTEDKKMLYEVVNSETREVVYRVKSIGEAIAIVSELNFQGDRDVYFWRRAQAVAE